MTGGDGVPCTATVMSGPSDSIATLHQGSELDIIFNLKKYVWIMLYATHHNISGNFSTNFEPCHLELKYVVESFPNTGTQITFIMIYLTVGLSVTPSILYCALCIGRKTSYSCASSVEHYYGAISLTSCSYITGTILLAISLTALVKNRMSSRYPFIVYFAISLLCLGTSVILICILKCCRKRYRERRLQATLNASAQRRARLPLFATNAGDATMTDSDNDDDVVGGGGLAFALPNAVAVMPLDVEAVEERQPFPKFVVGDEDGSAALTSLYGSSDTTLCVICNESVATTACMPCLHLCLCAPCVEAFEKQHSACPICRTGILFIVTVDRSHGKLNGWDNMCVATPDDRDHRATSSTDVVINVNHNNNNVNVNSTETVPTNADADAELAEGGGNGVSVFLQQQMQQQHGHHGGDDHFGRATSLPLHPMDFVSSHFPEHNRTSDGKVVIAGNDDLTERLRALEEENVWLKQALESQLRSTSAVSNDLNREARIS